MTAGNVIVAPDMLRRQTAVLELCIEQDATAGTKLTVDQADIGTSQIVNPPYIFWIALRHHDSFLPNSERNDGYG